MQEEAAAEAAAASGLRTSALAGLQSEFGELVNRKTNSWSLCLSQGLLHPSPNWESAEVQAREKFCELRASLPSLKVSKSPPISGNRGTSAQDAARSGWCPQCLILPRQAGEARAALGKRALKA